MPQTPAFRRVFGGFTIACALLAGITPASLGATTQISVDADSLVRTIEARHFGVNTAVWDGNLNSTDTTAILKDTGLRTLRFPGGSTSDTYHWKTNTSDGNTWQWATSFDSFINILQADNARVFITVNYGSGTAQEAADWVTYANSNKRLNIKYWEVGNECYGSWENDVQAVKWDPYTYATRFADYYTKMKAADPTIRIGAVVTTGEDAYANNKNHSATNPRTGAVHYGWTPVMLATLKGLGVTPDFVIYHRYEQQPGSESDAGLLQSAKTWPADAADLRQQLNDYLGSTVAAGIELVVTENNSVSYNPGKQSTSLVDALFYCDSFGNLVQTEFNAFVWWALRNGPPKDSSGNLLGNFSSSLYGWRTYGDYGIVPSPGYGTAYHPTYYAMKLVSKFAHPNDEVVKASSDNTLLSCFAARHTDGSLGLMVINKSPTDTLSASFSLAHFAPGATATTYAYGIPQDNAARDGTGSTDLTQGTLAIPGTAFTASFAPYSITVLSIPPSVAASAQPRLTALSTRGYVGPSSNENSPLIVGVICSGSETVVLRGVGPTLSAFGISNPLPDPTLKVYDQNSQLAAQNDNWGGDATLATLFAKLGEFALPASSLDAALQYTVGSGLMTAYVASSGSADGAAIAEIYEADHAAGANMIALSTRGTVGTGQNVLVGGFVIDGTTPTTVLIRGIGPTLQDAFALAAAGDTRLDLYDGNNRLICSNDDWGGEADIAAAFTRTGAFALNTLSKDAAILITLPPGRYTAQVTAVGGKSLVPAAGTFSGQGMIEIYQIR